ncbi:hypothetical protein EP51_03450 [Rhodococcus opacus]|uniref:Bacterial bifunctional deaminase-reductase C-terminal domain-containing protein n=1 Tax=Rhodococcus opacus TaxID=37919 RepID=A0A076EEY5_RHOOP|nr:hypothetical protein EP51_03450 [Rhodococcus opacus]
MPSLMLRSPSTGPRRASTPVFPARINRLWHGTAPAAIRFDLIASRAFDDGVVWLRYQPVR